MSVGILTFLPVFMERIWGGDKLSAYLGREPDTDARIGEAWLVSDHAACASTVAEGLHAGKTLRQLMEAHGSKLLGDRVSPTPDGRFPLLLKLIDAGDILSVQVHPDDEQAIRLGEPDVGKTEMWHVLEADMGATLTSGLCAGVTQAGFSRRLRQGDVAPLLRRFAVAPGDSVFVAAGTIHAIGAGILLAEIQQNSDITYRLFDWNRVGADGQPRELHIDKALAVLDFSAAHGGRVAPLRYTEGTVVREVLSACRYFAAEKVSLHGEADFNTGGTSFHIVLSLEAPLTLRTENNACELRPGAAALIPGAAGAWQAVGRGTFLDYYVPYLPTDIIEVLRRHGYADEQIALLGGATPANDLRRCMS